MSREGDSPVIANLDEVQPVLHSCGASYRLITRAHGAALGLHVVELSGARAHFHKKTAEVYYILEGEGEVELNGRSVPVRPGTAVYIPPGVVHRAVGRMKAVIATAPPYDSEDEYLV